MKTAYGDHLTLTTDGHVATIVIDRPANNHVSVDLMRDLADALEAMDRDNNIRAVPPMPVGETRSAPASAWRWSPTSGWSRPRRGSRPTSSSSASIRALA